MLVNTLYIFLDLLLFTLNILIIIRMVASWFMSPEGRLAGILADLTEPVVGPVRRIIPPMSGIDLAPLVTLLAIDALRYLLFYL